jgi:hypothetical protein
MANPRAYASFRQVRPIRDTYQADGTTVTYDGTQNNGSAQVGMAVGMSSVDKTVKLCADAQRCMGVIEHVEADLRCAVWVGDYVSFPVNGGGSLAAGTRVCGAAGGTIRAVVAATLADVYAAFGTVICADATTAGRVIVKMD